MDTISLYLIVHLSDLDMALAARTVVRMMLQLLYLLSKVVSIWH
jgi:hypothetical protein